jgi:hypothetical protein
MKKIIMLTVLFSLFFVACKKTNEPIIEKKPTFSELIVNKKWQMTAFHCSPPLFGDSNFYETFEPCQKDNYDFYYTNSNLDYNVGEIKCDPNEAQIFTTSWIISNDTLYRSKKAEVLEIIKLEDKFMRLRSYQKLAGTQYTYLIEYKTIE